MRKTTIHSRKNFPAASMGYQAQQLKFDTKWRSIYPLIPEEQSYQNSLKPD